MNRYNSIFKQKATKPLKRSVLKQLSANPTAECKRRIQALLNQIVTIRDGGCLLRNSPEAGLCGSRPTKDGHLILQAEHLHTRSNAASYSDSRLVICLCERHHIFYKPKHPDEYYRLVKGLIGPKRTALLEAVQNDYKPHKVDFFLEEIALQKELVDLKKNTSGEVLSSKSKT